MAKMTVSTEWLGKMRFASTIGDHRVFTDAAKEHGGDGSAPSPKPLMIAALAGCTGVDVIAILDKMRVIPESLEIAIETEVTELVPSIYSGMHLIYRFTGAELDVTKLKRAVELSQEKYCGVSAMYRKFLDISYQIEVNGELVAESDTPT